MKGKVFRDLENIAARFNIADIYVFGSRAQEIAACVRGSASPVAAAGTASDADFGVLTRARVRLSAEQRVDLAAELEDLFEVARVDLVMLPEADPYLALEIIRGELLYAADPDEQARFELFVLRRAGDLMPFKKERMRMILEEGAK